MIKITKKDIIWSYLGNIVNVGMNLFVLPFVLRMLDSEEIGMWYVFASITALVSLLDFGFSPTILRNISYAWSGASELKTEGAPLSGSLESPNYQLVNRLMLASKRIYLIISLIAGVTLLFAGTPYILGLVNRDIEKYIIAWGIQSAAIFINLYYSFWTPLLKGIGEIKATNQIQIQSRILYIILSIAGLLLGGGLIWLSIVYLISGLVIRVLSKKFFLQTSRINEYMSGNSEPESVLSTLKIIWPNASKMGLVIAGSWLITRASTLICSKYYGLEATAQYGLSLQLISGVASFSTLLFSSYTPEIASSFANQDTNRLIQLFSRALILQWIVGILGSLAIILVGPFGLVLIGSNSTLLPNPVLIVMGIVYLLESNHSTFAGLITLTNRVPFVAASLYSGAGIVLLSLVFVRFTSLGLMGLVLAQGLVQLVYSNWYWPRMVCKENHTTIFKLFQIGAKEYFQFFIRTWKFNGDSRTSL